MSKLQLIRLSGLAAMLGGLMLIPGSISFDPPWSVIGMFGSVLLVFGLIGIYAVQTEKSGVAGFFGFVLSVVGAVLLSGNGDLAGVPAWMIGSGFAALGIVLLAIGTFASGSFPRWVPWVWLAAVVVGFPGVLVESLAQTLGVAGSILSALGMVGAGYALWSRPN